MIAEDFEAGKPSKVEYDFGNPGVHDQEGRVVTAFFDKFILVASYIPNSGVDGLNRLGYRTKEWDRDLQSFLKDELEEKAAKPVIWCGDLNVAHHEIDICNPKGKEKQAGFTKEER